MWRSERDISGPEGAPGYDVIGDVHGCATELEHLLAEMGYVRDPRTTAYRHPNPDRTAVFVGDLIDRGPEQLRVLRLVKAMVDSGTALLTLGNHEFNALAYRTKDPRRPGKYLRNHGDPDDPDSAKHAGQHREFLEQLHPSDRDYYLDWLGSQPLWLDLGELRVIHACWHPPSMDTIVRELGANRIEDLAGLVRATDKAGADPVYAAIEVLLKGPEVGLAAFHLPPYRDKDGNPRHKSRIRWWDAEATSPAELLEVKKFKTLDGGTYPQPPAGRTGGAEAERYAYHDEVPVFFGHYWRTGEPARREDYTDYTACVDFSAVKGGKDGGSLKAYRWSMGQSRIDPTNYVSVPPATHPTA